MIIVWGSTQAIPQKKEEAIAISLEHVQRSRTEPGCIRHGVSVDAENDCTLIFYEEWENMQALQQHFKVSESEQFVERISSLSEGAPSMKIFDASLSA